MDMIMPVGKSLAAASPEFPVPSRQDGVAGADFSALMANKRGQEGLSANPLVQAAMRMSDTYQDTLTQRIASSFERDQKAKSASERFVNSMEDLDAVMSQKSRLGIMEVVSKSFIKNIETLTTKMS